MNKENNSSSKKIYGTRSERYKDNRTMVGNTSNKSINTKKKVPKTNTPKKIVPNKKKVNKKTEKTKILNIKDLEKTQTKLFDIGIDKINLEKNKKLEEEQIKIVKERKKIVAKKKLEENKKNAAPKVKIVKKRKLRKGVIFNAIITLFIIGAIGVFIYSAIDIYKWNLDNQETANLTDQINEQVDVSDVNEDDSDIIVPEEVDEPEGNPYWDYIKMSLIDVDLNELKKTNPEVVGWVQVNGTNINYPFVQTTNNDYYLTHSFNRNYNSAGWVFLDYRNSINDLDKNTIIYAHGRWDKTMFGSLKNLLNTNWYQNLDNHVIKVYLNGKSSLWQVFSVYHIPTTNDYIQTKFSTDESFQNFIDLIRGRSFYTFNTNVSVTDKIITLSTCYNDNEKMVMHAKLIKYTN